ncbi:hypothetical protein QFC19_000713 [Naganishia cerealis]|uniref:Uncharacterized protein n=1 Tax=Naganishia cerealis TaxID=610337 RepID=A0ACC2WM45_9TREE|nr:hypothetical protein QFC19_000713 [Naganishia cerealis]
MPPGFRLTRSHITTIHARINPFHPATSRPIQLLLNLIATPDNTTQLRPSPAAKAAPSPNVNVIVDILPVNATSSQLSVGYADGKVENMKFDALAQISGAIRSKYPRVQMKQEEVINIASLVEKVDAHARTLKAKDEGIS